MTIPMSPFCFPLLKSAEISLCDVQKEGKITYTISCKHPCLQVAFVIKEFSFSITGFFSHGVQSDFSPSSAIVMLVRYFDALT